METERNSGESSGMRYHLPIFNRRSDAIVYGSTYQKAAALVDLAENGKGLPEEFLNDQSAAFAEAAKFYFIFIRFDYIWSLNHFALLLLNFLEKPLWCSHNVAISCNNRDYYFLGQLPYLDGAGSLVYEGITLVILIAHMIFPISYEGFNLYWKNHFNKVKIIFLLILVTDVLIYVLYLSPVAFSSLPFRMAPYVRVGFFILNVRYIRETLVVLAGMISNFINLLIMGLLFLVFSSWLAYVMFEDTEQGKTEFTSYGATIYRIFILFTTSNNPDVWVPAYKASRWYSLFFILYVLLGVYFLTNLILAVVYDSFKGQLAKQVKAKDHIKTGILKKAFDLIDNGEYGYLDKVQCCRLFQELSRYSTLPNISREDYDIIFQELDDSRDFKIDLVEFYELTNAIALMSRKEDSRPWLDNFPRFYYAPLSKILRTFVRTPKFSYIVIFLLILNLVSVIGITQRIHDNSGQGFWKQILFVIGWLFFLEMALEVYSFGFKNCWKDGQNRFDFSITFIVVIVQTATFLFSKRLPFLSNEEWSRYLLMARILQLTRLLFFVDRYRAFVVTFLTLIPILMPYLGTIFCVLCMYCSLGVQIFGGLVNAGNPHLAGTDIADNDYQLFNFNDYPSGMVTLFNLLVMGNWQSWMQSYKVLTDSAWSYMYFISFFVLTILLLLNVVIAFVLEAYFANLDIEAAKYDTEESTMRNAGMEPRSLKVDLLLHRMLSSEMRA